MRIMPPSDQVNERAVRLNGFSISVLEPHAANEHTTTGIRVTIMLPVSMVRQALLSGP